MCTSPKKAWLPNEKNSDGKRPLEFKIPPASKLLQFKMVDVGCNHCIACESIRSVKQAVQLACELKFTQGESQFITLTYDDEHLPEDYSVHIEHLQTFIKRLRHHIERHKRITGKFRYSSVGEYGGMFQRPHYHLAAFDLNLDDLEVYSKQQSSNGEYNVYESPLLTEIWGLGSIKLIPLQFENCLYITQHHFADKVNQTIPDYKKHVNHPITGKLIKLRKKEFSTRSSRPGIGKKYFEKYYSEIFIGDSIIVNKREFSVPNYFVKLLKIADLDQYEKIKADRAAKVKTKTFQQNQYQANYDQALIGNDNLKGKTNIKAGKYYKKEMNQI